eukprot:TRINITY_DN993_c0_g2_i1.p1 TRINITY_DN993_c0_g2~~TRINITY_DN993_c0_g2_i1.p1  ORF type:complete len:422 (+),score=67.15 TRINITY_DN993_c0_g2_i1:74-1267(+)
MATESDKLVQITDNDKAEDEELDMKAIKMRFGGLMLFCFIVGVVFREVAVIFKFLKSMNHECDGNKSCLADQACLRISFALCVFYTVHAVLSSKFSITCFGEAQFIRFMRSGLCFKFIALVILIVVSFVLPADFINGYAYYAFALSIIFLLMQCVIFLNFAHTWNESWIPKDGWTDDDEDLRLKRAAVCCTGFLFALCITGVGLMYHFFNPSGCADPEKSVHLFFITFTLLFGIMFFAASAFLSGGSILVASIAFGYCTAMTFSAIMSGSNSDDCNILYSDNRTINFNTILSLLIAAVTVVYTSVQTGTEGDSFSESKSVSFSYSFFFSCLMCGACYMAMVLNSWDITDTGKHYNSDVAVGMSKAAMWMKMATVWITMVLFIIALIMPICAPDRFAN